MLNKRQILEEINQLIERRTQDKENWSEKFETAMKQKDYKEMEVCRAVVRNITNEIEGIEKAAKIVDDNLLPWE